MQSIINGSFGTAAGLGFFLLGVPYAILWAFSPPPPTVHSLVGPPVAAVLPSALAWQCFPAGTTLLVIRLVLILELAGNMIMELLLYGQSAGVPGGIAGGHCLLDVAVGAVDSIGDTLNRVHRRPRRKHPTARFLGVLLGDEPIMEVRRLLSTTLAHDEDEAAALVEDYLKTLALEDCLR